MSYSRIWVHKIPQVSNGWAYIPVEVEQATFFGIDELSIQHFELDTEEYYLNFEEPGNDPKLKYDIPGIDLIKSIEAYSPVGVLVWFPEFGEYGSWDCDHSIVWMMPDLTWELLLKDPGKFINVQWYPDRVQHYLLRPWADLRCSHFQSHI